MAVRKRCVVDLPRTRSSRGHAGQQAARDSVEIAHAGRERPDRVVRSCSENEGALFVLVANDDIQTSVGFALPVVNAAVLRRVAGHGLHSFVGVSSAGLTIADADRATVSPVEVRVLDAQV